MHGVELAKALNMKEIAVPAHPGISSAVGMLSADVRHDYVRTHISFSGKADVSRIQSIFEDMEAQGTQQLGREGFRGPSVSLVRLADMRYIRQSYELSVPVRGGALEGPDLARLSETFHDLHQKAYGYARNGEAVEFVNLRVVALGKLPEFRVKQRPSETGKDPEPLHSREVNFGGRAIMTPVYSRDSLPEGVEIQGPAIVEQMDSTITVLPEYRAVSDRFGNLLIRDIKRGVG
jgi:N-methylhydantoinase A